VGLPAKSRSQETVSPLPYQAPDLRSHPSTPNLHKLKNFASTPTFVSTSGVTDYFDGVWLLATATTHPATPIRDFTASMLEQVQGSRCHLGRWVQATSFLSFIFCPTNPRFHRFEPPRVFATPPGLLLEKRVEAVSTSQQIEDYAWWTFRDSDFTLRAHAPYPRD